MNKQKTTQTIVLASLTGAIAFFGYRFYKTYKELKRDAAIEKEHTERMEALELIKEEKRKKEETHKELLESFESPINGAVAVYSEAWYHEQVDAEALEMEVLAHEEARDLDYDDEEEESDIFEEIEEEGVEPLRFPPNSADALTQYKEMRLAEFDTIVGAKRTLWMLFRHPFKPSNNKDRTIYDQIVEERREFFGDDSIHTDQATMAELILHFGNLLDYDLDGGVEYWTDILLANTEITAGIGELDMDKVREAIQEHRFINRQGGYGIFALDADQYERMLRQPGQIGPITFLRQYHVYVGDIINGRDAEEEVYNG